MTVRNLNYTKLASALGVAFVLVTNAASAQAQPAPWPSKPVRIVVGFPGGSTPDAAARTLAEEIGRAHV